MRPLEDALHLYVIVGEDPYDDDERLALYGGMLRRIFFCHDTGGGSLGWTTRRARSC